MKRIIFTRHGADSLDERVLRMEWIEAAARQPDWREPDPCDPEVERRYFRIVQLDGRVLRVACVEDQKTIRIVTAFLNRKARRRK